MPIVEILYANDDNRPTTKLVKAMTAAIRQEFCIMGKLRLLPHQVSVHFRLTDVDTSTMDLPELIVHAWGLTQKPERTQDVLDRLARGLLTAVNECLPVPDPAIYPKRPPIWRVEVLVESWGPDPKLYAEARNP